jgi:hypothetical protein
VPRELCAHCSIEGAVGPEIVPYSVLGKRGAVQIRWLHSACSEPWHARYRAWLSGVETTDNEEVHPPNHSAEIAAAGPADGGLSGSPLDARAAALASMRKALSGGP